MEYTVSMRINLPEEQLTYIGEIADKLDISIPELCKRAIHIVDTIQLCEAQGIKAVFIEEEEHLEFKDLFNKIYPADGNNTPVEGATAVQTGPVDPF